MEKRQVAYVAGMAFCGSSLLNVMLDSQPGIVGMGERMQLHADGGPCTACRDRVSKCKLYGGRDPRQAYALSFAHYRCSTLVDSSKSVKHLLASLECEPNFFRRLLVLSKDPWSHCHSIVTHWEKPPRLSYPELTRPDRIRKALDAWIATYRHIRRESKRLLLPVLQVHYERLTGARLATMRRICRFLAEEFDPSKLSEGVIPHSDTHILGGNPAVIAAVTSDEELAFHGGVSTYLDGKYASRDRRIRRDDSWRRDHEFLRLARPVINDRWSDLRQIAAWMGRRPTLV